MVSVPSANWPRAAGHHPRGHQQRRVDDTEHRQHKPQCVLAGDDQDVATIVTQLVTNAATARQLALSSPFRGMYQIYIPSLLALRRMKKMVSVRAIRNRSRARGIRLLV